MPRAIGVLAAEHLAAGLVEGNKLAGGLTIEGQAGGPGDVLQGAPAESVTQNIAELVARIARRSPAAIRKRSASAFPGSSSKASSRIRPTCIR